MSTGVEAMKMPESPPMTNIETNASALSIGTVNWIRAPQSVPSQLKVLMADGTAMIIVVTVKAIPSAGLMPLTNMWWPQTTHDRNAMEIIEKAMPGQPKMGLRQKNGRIAGPRPVAGR